MRSYPQSTTNQNVPKDVFLVAETESMSGEIKVTYYIDYAGNIWRVGDWINDKPKPTTFHQLYTVTGDTEKMIIFRWRKYFNLTIHKSE